MSRTFIDKEFEPVEGIHTVITRDNDRYVHYTGKCDLKRVYKYWIGHNGIEAIKCLEVKMVPHKKRKNE